MNPPVSLQPPRRLANNGRGPKRRALISLTPLIDVVFILLIFFMLASSFLDWRSIDLDAPDRSAKSDSMHAALLIEIRKDGLRLSGETMSLERLKQRVLDRLAVNPEQKVLVRPDSTIVLQQAVDLLDHMAAVGVTDLSLVRSGKQ